MSLGSDSINFRTSDEHEWPSLRIQEDFTIMLEGSDGRYYLQAGAVCIAGTSHPRKLLTVKYPDQEPPQARGGSTTRWAWPSRTSTRPATFLNVSEAYSITEPASHACHASDKDKLQMSMERYFRRMPVDKPIVRNNYAFQVVAQPEMRRPAPPAGSLLDVDPGELAWAVTMNGDEETSEYERAKHINEQYDENGYPTSLQYRLEKVETPATAETLHLRTERQTLRRLPRTGAIVFTIRVYQTRLAELVKEPGVPGRIASAIRSWPEDVARYGTSCILNAAR